MAENTKRILCACPENRVRPEITILDADQKERGHWGRECSLASSHLRTADQSESAGAGTVDRTVQYCNHGNI